MQGSRYVYYSMCDWRLYARKGNARFRSINKCYASFNLAPLHETRVMIQLANKSNAYPKGMIEDVLVRVIELIFPADFYIIDMDDDCA